MGGSTLSAALQTYPEKVPEVMVGLIAAGEAGGALAPVFHRLADGFEMQLRTQDALRSALIYPAVLGVTALASLVLVLTVVAPALTPVFAGAGDRTPLSAQNPDRRVRSFAQLLVDWRPRHSAAPAHDDLQLPYARRPRERLPALRSTRRSSGRS